MRSAGEMMLNTQRPKHAVELHDVRFVNDWGVQIIPSFLRATGWLTFFWAGVLVVSALEGAFSSGIESFVLTSLFGFGVVIALAAYVVVFDPQAQIEFRNDGIGLDSLLRVKAGYGSCMEISYERCKVYERHYWKFINHYFLVFYDGRKAVFSISKSSWEKSYDRIKLEIQRRLTASSYTFETVPVDSEPAT